ncbi:MAG: COX15/CtaA family protein [Pseudomonas sp.]|nr:COX15/CtaA family protein [Pseudomonas sp.]MBF0676885.1 COX15/CtaA family protein [Pseudomonas sp.]
MRKPGYWLSLFAFALAGVVVLLGAYTRLTHAGLGCPDWPGCYGFLGVPMSEQAQALAAARFPEAPLEVHKGWNEMVHRYFAGALGLVILGLAIQALRRRNEVGQPLGLPLLLLGVVITQALFGMWTVTLQLWPQVVTAHLLGGFATLALLFLLSVRLSGYGAAVSPIPRRLRRLAGVALLLAIGQITLGGWVSSNYAAVACPDFPTCQGVWWPSMDFANGLNLTQHIGPNYLGGLLYGDARTAIHMSHRLGALVLSLVLLLLAWQLWRHRRGRLAALLVLALGIQLGLGVANVLLHLPLAVAVAHNGGGAALLLVLVLINERLRSPLAERCTGPLDVWGQPVVDIRPLKNVGEAGRTRRKQPKKRSLGVLNEHSEAVFHDVLPTQVGFKRPDNS